MTPKNKQTVIVGRILCAMVIFLGLRCLDAAAYRAAATPGGLFSIDFGPAYSAAQRLNAHQPLYIPENNPDVLLDQYVSSPLLPVLLRPIARHPLDQATRAWAAINVALLTAAVFLCCWGAGLRLLEDGALVLLMFFTGFRYWPTTIELGIGNSDMVLLFFAAGMFACNRYRKWLLFALLVALAALTKTWMIGALFYLLARREWKAAFAGVGFFAAGAAVLFTIVGWREMPVLWHLTRLYSAQPSLVSNSVAGIAGMFFRKNMSISPLVNSPVLWGAAMLIGYGFLIAGLMVVFLRAPSMDAWQLRVSLGLTVLALVLGCPVSHQYYFVLALPLLWALLIPPADGSGGWGIPVVAFLIYLAFSIPSPSLNPVPESYRHGIRSLEVGISFFSGMLLWACGLFAVMRGAAAPAVADRTAAAPMGAALVQK